MVALEEAQAEIKALRAEFLATAQTLKTVSQDDLFKAFCSRELVGLVNQTLAIRTVQGALKK